VELCPCGEQCKNRRFQKHEDSCIYPFRCGGKGWGLAAGEKIYKGQFVMQYIGEIFQTQSTLGRRRTQEYAKSTCTYLMKINN
jgi:AWS domain